MSNTSLWGLYTMAQQGNKDRGKDLSSLMSQPGGNIVHFASLSCWWSVWNNSWMINRGCVWGDTVNNPIRSLPLITFKKQVLRERGGQLLQQHKRSREDDGIDSPLQGEALVWFCKDRIKILSLERFPSVLVRLARTPTGWPNSVFLPCQDGRLTLKFVQQFRHNQGAYQWVEDKAHWHVSKMGECHTSAFIP